MFWTSNKRRNILKGLIAIYAMLMSLIHDEYFLNKIKLLAKRQQSSFKSPQTQTNQSQLSLHHCQVKKIKRSFLLFHLKIHFGTSVYLLLHRMT